MLTWRCSPLLIIREMQIKTIQKYHLTLVRLVIIKKTKNNKRCQECRENWILLHFWRRKRQPTSVFLPGEFHEQKSLAGYSPWDRKESDMTKRLKHHHTFDGNFNRCSYHWKHYGDSLKTYKYITIIWSSYSSPGYVSKENKNIN